MRNQKQLLILITVIFSIVIQACKKDENKPDTPDLTSQGVFIVNEGAFGGSNGSISYLNLLNNSVSNNIFENINGFPLGDVAQSMTIHGSNAYMLVNASKKIEVVNAVTFNSIATITGLEGPRYMIAKGTKAYVSDWFENNIKVVDLTSNTIINTISTGSGPEQMLLVGNKLFVTNVGGWGSDSTVTVIDINAEIVTATLNVGINPNSIRMDDNGNIWVLCNGSTGPDFNGGTADDIAGSLWRINPATLSIELHLEMNSADHPTKLQTNASGSELYYLKGTDGYNGKIFRMLSTSLTLSSSPLTTKEFYGLGVDPVSGIVYGGHSPGFSQDGYVFRYSTAFALIDSMQVGIGPNQFVFQ